MPQKKFPANTTLGQKVSTLLRDDADPARPQEHDRLTPIHGIARDMDRDPFRRHGIDSHSVTIFAPNDEDSGSVELLVCREGDTYVVARVSYPGYCDDNFDGEVTSMSADLTYEEMKQAVEAQVAGEVESLESQVRDLRDTGARFILSLMATRGREVECDVEEDEEEEET